MAASNDCNYSATSIGHGLVAGYSAGICGVMIGHPLDSIKVHLQTGGRAASGTSSSSAAAGASNDQIISRASSTTAANAVPASSSAKANMSTSTAAAATPKQSALISESTIGKRSLRALYAGVTGPLMTVGLLQSLNFAIYDTVRRALYQRHLHSDKETSGVGHPDDYLHYDDLSNVALASFAAGATLSTLTAPMMIVKTKQQLMVWGFREAIRDTYTGGTSAKPNPLRGLRNFYTGFGLNFFCDAFGRSLYMLSYEGLKRELARRKDSEQSSYGDRVSTQILSTPDRMVCAASAGMMCWAFIYPADVIRSKLYQKSLTTQSSLTTLDGIKMAREMVREQGIRSLYRGVGITVARAGPVAAAVLPVYDSVLEWVSS